MEGLEARQLAHSFCGIWRMNSVMQSRMASSVLAVSLAPCSSDVRPATLLTPCDGKCDLPAIQIRIPSADNALCGAQGSP